MSDLKTFRKYYFLEDYLFGEVNKNFKTKGFLTPEEFFAIVIWKSNRSKTKVRDGIIASKKSIKAITSDVAKAETLWQKIEILKNISGIGIPVASAILSVCFPADFTVVDYRSRAALKELGVEISGDPTADIKDYLTYLGKCQLLAKEQCCSLRDLDRILWGKDFYEGESGLSKLVCGMEI